MAKIIFFFVFLGVIIYPIYEVSTQKDNFVNKIKKDIFDLVIDKGKFFVYEENLSEYGNFERLKHKKDIYVSDNLVFIKVKSNEKIASENALYKNNKAFFRKFFYENNDYNFSSNEAVYSFNKKEFKGKDFMLSGITYKAKGKSFIIDKNKNIKATKTIFDIKDNR